MIDSHCHLTVNHFEDDLEATMARAVIDGVSAFLNIGFEPEQARATIELMDHYPFILGAVGIHPHDATALNDEFERTLYELADRDRVVAIGEIGLDYYRDLSPRDVQAAAFDRMLTLAQEKHKPIIIHCRDAFDDLMAKLRERGETYRGIFHAFTGTPEEAEQILELGFHLGIGGVATFKNSRLASTIKKVPADRIVLETDSPYLTPHPYRGKRNEPAYVAHVARAVAQSLGMTPAELVKTADMNLCVALEVPPERMPGPVYKIEERVYVHTLAAQPDALSDVAEDSVDELVLCGFGESTDDLERTLALAKAGRDKGWDVRLNTDGLGNRTAERDITPELAEFVDETVVVFYGTNATHHDRNLLTDVGNEGFEMMCDFVRCSVKAGMDTICEFVATPKFKPEACRELAKKLGAQYDIRMYRS